jgi:putative endonuclease
MQRLKSHNELAHKGWTIKFRPWEIIHTETFDLKQTAIKREKELKTAKGRQWIWQLINNS